MYVLSLVFSSSIQNMANQMPQFEEICLHKNFKKECFNFKGEGTAIPSTFNEETVRPWVELFHLEIFICILNFTLWIYLAIDQWKRIEKDVKTSISMLSLSCSIGVRILFSTVAICISLVYGSKPSLIKSIVLQLSLYLDYCCHFFSIAISFVITLNYFYYCTFRNWHSRNFKFHKFGVLIFTFLFSIICAMSSILTSQIERIFQCKFGFLDFGKNENIQMIINRVTLIFPCVSLIIGYLIFRMSLKKRTSGAANHSKCKEKIVLPIFVTTLVYTILCVINEIIYFTTRKSSYEFQFLVFSTLRLSNSLPEILLAILLICTNNHIKMKKKCIKWIKSKTNTSTRVNVTNQISYTANPIQ